MKYNYKRIIILIMFFTTELSLFAFEEGQASWYGGKFQGRKTANGEIFDTYKFTAAHKTLPFNTIVKVINLKNGKDVEVRINDRGPFVKDRIIDLSMAAASKIDLTSEGIVMVRLEIIKLPNGMKEKNIKKSIEVHPEGIPESYRLQIASFSNTENAQRNLLKLKNAGINAEKEITDAGMIRIIVNNVKKKEIPDLVELIKKAGYSPPLIRSNLK